MGPNGCGCVRAHLRVDEKSDDRRAGIGDVFGSGGVGPVSSGSRENTMMFVDVRGGARRDNAGRNKCVPSRARGLPFVTVNTRPPVTSHHK